MHRTDILFALGLGLLLYVLWTLRSTLLLIYVSVLFSMIFAPAVGRIQRLRLWRWQPSQGVAILLLVAIVLGVAAVVVLLMLPPIVHDAQGLASDLPYQLEQLSRRMEKLPLGQRIAHYVNPASVTRYLDNFVQYAFGTLKSVAGGVVDIVLLAILTAYFMLDGKRAFRWAMSLVPTGERDRLADTLVRAKTRAQKWLTGQLLLMLILGSCTVVVLGLLNVRYFYALALFAALANFVPIVGPVATVLVAGAIAALDSWLKLLSVVAFYLIYQQVENAYLTPRIMKSTVGLPAISVMIALVIGADLAGILGALVAVPTAALIATVANEYLVRNRPS